MGVAIGGVNTLLVDKLLFSDKQVRGTTDVVVEYPRRSGTETQTEWHKNSKVCKSLYQQYEVRAWFLIISQ